MEQETSLQQSLVFEQLSSSKSVEGESGYYDYVPYTHPEPKILTTEETIHMLRLIRSYWEFSAVSQFFHLFYFGFMDEEFDTDRLEMLIITDDYWVQDLIVKMLRMATKNRFIMPDCWLMYLDREYQKRELTSPFEFRMDLLYTDLSIYQKVVILNYLCEIQLERTEGFKPVHDVAEVTAKHWRVESIGSDYAGNKYWLFDDSRLFMEPHKKRPLVEGMPNPNWVLKCLELHEWKMFPEEFAESRHNADQLLYHYMVETLYPLVLRDIKYAQEKRLTLGRPQPIHLESKRLVQQNKRESEKMALLPDPVIGLGRRVLRKPIREPAVLDGNSREHRMQTREERLLGMYADKKNTRSRESRASQRIQNAPRKKNKKYFNSESEEELETEEEEGSMGELDDIEEVSPAASPKLSPKNSNIPCVLAVTQNVAGDVWLFKCMCGVKGENIDGIVVLTRWITVNLVQQV